MTRKFRPTEAPPLYSQDGKGLEATCYAHYFIASSDWLITEYDPDDGIAFGWACLNGDRQMAELGYVDIGELEAVRIPIRVMQDGTHIGSIHAQVERDAHWEPISLRRAIDLIDRRNAGLDDEPTPEETS